jgi:transcriptional regulator with XRE-family HTH domain
MRSTRPYITLEEMKRRLMRNPEFRRVYESAQPDWDLVHEVLRMRIKRKMTQEQLAESAGTSQSRIARIEHANDNPSLDVMKRIAEALDCKLEIRFVPKRKRKAAASAKNANRPRPASTKGASRRTRSTNVQVPAQLKGRPSGES